MIDLLIVCYRVSQRHFDFVLKVSKIDLFSSSPRSRYIRFSIFSRAVKMLRIFWFRSSGEDGVVTLLLDPESSPTFVSSKSFVNDKIASEIRASISLYTLLITSSFDFCIQVSLFKPWPWFTPPEMPKSSSFSIKDWISLLNCTNLSFAKAWISYILSIFKLNLYIILEKI